MKHHLIAAWREHGVENVTAGERAINAVTAAGALTKGKMATYKREVAI
jgi:hypothetical protein